MSKKIMLLEILKVISWPVCGLIIALVFIFLFRASIEEMMPRLAKSDIQVSNKGLRISFEQSLQSQIVQMDAQQRDIKAIVDTSVRSYNQAVVLAWGLLENKLRRILAVSHWNDGKFSDIKTSLSVLVSLGVLAPNSVPNFRTLESEYSRILSHTTEGSKQNTEVAIITAIQLLRGLYSISLQDNIIQQVGIPIYEDKNCTVQFPGVTAIAIKQIMVDGIPPVIGVFPTSRQDYKVGEHVTWDWNNSRIITDKWYKDPISGEVKSINAMEFIGGNLDDL